MKGVEVCEYGGWSILEMAVEREKVVQDIYVHREF